MCSLNLALPPNIHAKTCSAMLNEAQVKGSHAVTIAGAASLCVLALAIASVRTAHAQSADLG
jgi:hypothetical protein